MNTLFIVFICCQKIHWLVFGILQLSMVLDIALQNTLVFDFCHDAILAISLVKVAIFVNQID